MLRDSKTKKQLKLILAEVFVYAYKWLVHYHIFIRRNYDADLVVNEWMMWERFGTITSTFSPYFKATQKTQIAEQNKETQISIPDIDCIGKNWSS